MNNANSLTEGFKFFPKEISGLANILIYDSILFDLSDIIHEFQRYFKESNKIIH